MSIYVGNLSFEVTKEDLNAAFAEYGSVKQVQLVESRAGIIQRPSLLDPSVQLSLHSAPDSIGQCLCSCGHNHGMTRVELPDCCFSSFGDFHLCGAN
jgi:hypothetical protein